jgi:hypothetical protein
MIDQEVRYLREIVGRSKFAVQDPNDLINQKPAPQFPDWQYPKHPSDELAAEFGLKGFEFEALTAAAMREMPNNTMLQDAYRKFLLIAKLACDSQLESVRKHQRQIAMKRAAAEDNFDQRVKNWNHRESQIRSNWQNSVDAIRHRWNQVVGGFRQRLDDKLLGELEPRDQDLVLLLDREGLLELKVQYIRGVKWHDIKSLSVQRIRDLVVELNSRPSGDFLIQNQKSAQAD